MSDRPTKTCPTCNEDFGPHRLESRGQFTGRVYCSKPCVFAAKRAATLARLGTKTCLWTVCGAEFGPTENQRRHPHVWAQRKFCSRACAIAHRTATQERRPRAPRKPDTRRRVRPAPDRSVFGDRKPDQVWRPAGFSPSPSRP